jgi:hypothetical protein
MNAVVHRATLGVANRLDIAYPPRGSQPLTAKPFAAAALAQAGSLCYNFNY